MSLSPASSAEPKTKSLLRRLREIVLTVIGGLLLFSTVLAVLQYANRTHWLLGAVMTLCYAVAVAFGLSDLRGKRARELPIHQGMVLVFGTAFTGIAVTASISWQLLRAGWAVYAPAPPMEQAYLVLVSYYGWVLLDLLPGLDAARLLGIESPLQPMNGMAGLPVVAFRVFVIFGILAGVKAWWSGRQPAPAASTILPERRRTRQRRRLRPKR